MAKSLKDQLKDWKQHKKDVDEELRDLKPRRPAPKPRMEAPPPQAAGDEEQQLSDEELFRRAVEGMGSASEAVLKKYDRTDDAPRRPPAPERSDKALFLDAVGSVKPEDVQRMKGGGGSRDKQADARFARRVARGEVQPENILDLHGDDRTRALERTRVFLDAEARSRSEVVLVVHGKGEGVLAAEVVRLLDEHPAVVEHLAAPKDLGGSGARVVRLRRARA